MASPSQARARSALVAARSIATRNAATASSVRPLPSLISPSMALAAQWSRPSVAISRRPRDELLGPVEAAGRLLPCSRLEVGGRRTRVLGTRQGDLHAAPDHVPRTTGWPGGAGHGGWNAAAIRAPPCESAHGRTRIRCRRWPATRPARDPARCRWGRRARGAARRVRSAGRALRRPAGCGAPPAGSRSTRASSNARTEPGSADWPDPAARSNCSRKNGCPEAVARHCSTSSAGTLPCCAARSRASSSASGARSSAVTGQPRARARQAAPIGSPSARVEIASRTGSDEAAAARSPR